MVCFSCPQDLIPITRKNLISRFKYVLFQSVPIAFKFQTFHDYFDITFAPSFTYLEFLTNYGNIFGTKINSQNKDVNLCEVYCGTGIAFAFIYFFSTFSDGAEIDVLDDGKQNLFDSVPSRGYKNILDAAIMHAGILFQEKKHGKFKDPAWKLL